MLWDLFIYFDPVTSSLNQSEQAKSDFYLICGSYVNYFSSPADSDSDSDAGGNHLGDDSAFHIRTKDLSELMVLTT